MPQDADTASALRLWHADEVNRLHGQNRGSLNTTDHGGSEVIGRVERDELALHILWAHMVKDTLSVRPG